MSMQFFRKQEKTAISIYLSNQRHERQTRAHLLGRCNNEPIKVLEFFRNYVTREEFEGNEILQRIAVGLRKEGFGDKIRFKSSKPRMPAESKTAIMKRINPIDRIRNLNYSEILEKRGLVKYADQVFA